MSSLRQEGLAEIGPAHRSRNLDVIRATAISMVLVFHIFGMSPVWIPYLSSMTVYGEYGVDLFFVLSGWLIGTLYWRERYIFGGVLIGRFWIRRWVRTIPPYAAALVLSYVAVAWYRGEHFNIAYLIFGQNYLHIIPFFEVSWSLCVEEHFYLLAPLLFLLWNGQRYERWHAIFPAIALLAPAIFRALGSPDSGTFGYAETATHLRCEGLALGFYVAYISVNARSAFNILNKFCPYLLVASLGFFVILAMMRNAELTYIFSGAIVSVLFISFLVVMVSCRDLITIGRLATPIAACSYSTYLTHSLAINIAEQIALRLPAHEFWLYFQIMLTLIISFSAGFYLTV